MCISVNCSQSRIANVCLSVHQSIEKKPSASQNQAYLPLSVIGVFRFSLNYLW